MQTITNPWGIATVNLMRPSNIWKIMDNGEVGTRHFKQRGWNYDEWCLFLIGVKNIAGWILLIYANDKTKYRNFEKGKLIWVILLHLCTTNPRSGHPRTTLALPADLKSSPSALKLQQTRNLDIFSNWGKREGTRNIPSQIINLFLRRYR